MRVHYEILNQKGTPAFYSDTYTNRPTYGFAGRVFISTDTGQIFEDTGSAWSLIADAGVGGGTLGSVCANGNSTSAGIIITAGGLSSNSITNTGITAGSVLFAGTGGLESQSNATFFWDNTNKRLGIGNNSPGAPLDIHGTGTQLQLNGTGSSNSYIQFQNAGVGKWRIGNTYTGGLNTFDIYNNGLTNTTLSFNVSNNNATFAGAIFTNTGWIALKENIGSANTSTYLTLNASSTGSTIESLILGLSAGTTMSLNFPTSSNYGYTFPATTGTLALTSDISGYLPLAGGTLTGETILSNSSLAFSGSGGAPSTNVGFRYTGAFYVYPGTNGFNIRKNDNSTNVFTVLDSGNTLIGTTTDNGNKLQITGNTYVSSLGTGLVYSNGGVLTSTNPSDKNLKINIEDIEWGLNEIIKLRPVSYYWKNDNINQGIQFGFIAQEVKEIMPSSIKNIQNKFLGLEKDAIYSTLVKAIQELNEKLLRNNIN